MKKSDTFNKRCFYVTPYQIQRLSLDALTTGRLPKDWQIPLRLLRYAISYPGKAGVTRYRLICNQLRDFCEDAISAEQPPSLEDVERNVWRYAVRNAKRRWL